MTRLALGISLAFVLACGGSSADRATAPVADTSPSPRVLTLLVVIDQLSAETLARLLPHLDDDGAIKTMIARGAYAKRLSFGYANTYTAPGHATLATGVLPRVHGVASNKQIDPATGVMTPLISGGGHTVLGRETPPAATASPEALRTPTIGDRLVASAAGAKVVAVSIKDRAAIFLGGKRPTAVYWFDKSIPAFTTSRYYAEERPPWLLAWQTDELPRMLETWTPSKPAALEALGADQQPGEGDWLGLGKTFPHDIAKAAQPWSVARATPASTRVLVGLAERASVEHGLGDDDIPDLLAISISATDYAGHALGASSWEFIDNLIVADRELGALWRRLEARVGPVSVVLSADHGHAPMPERSKAGGRLYVDDVAAALERALVAELGPGPWIAGLAHPTVILRSRATPHRARIAKRVIAMVEAMPEVDRVIDLKAGLKAGADARDEVDALVASGRPPDDRADFYIVVKRGSIFDDGSPRGGGTSHGSPWDYDRDVPMLVVSPWHQPGQTISTGDTRQVASTLAQVLGLDVELPLPPL